MVTFSPAFIIVQAIRWTEFVFNWASQWRKQKPSRGWPLPLGTWLRGWEFIQWMAWTEVILSATAASKIQMYKEVTRILQNSCLFHLEFSNNNSSFSPFKGTLKIFTWSYEFVCAWIYMCTCVQCLWSPKRVHSKHWAKTLNPKNHICVVYLVLYEQTTIPSQLEYLRIHYCM